MLHEVRREDPPLVHHAAHGHARVCGGRRVRGMPGHPSASRAQYRRGSDRTATLQEFCEEFPESIQVVEVFL